MRAAFAPSILLIAAVAVIVASLRAMLHLPGVPYNVSELFLDKGSLPSLVFFAVAVLWIGGGAMALADALARSRRPYILLPIGLIVVALISKMLVSRAVTYESLDDILGADIVFSWVTREGAWGRFWRDAFLRMNAGDFVDFIERRVRYTALYSLPQLPLVLALTFTAVRRRARDVVLVLAAAVAWYALCYQIVVPWAATDNLTELIAMRTRMGLRGFDVLFGVAVLIALDVAAFVRANGRPRHVVVAASFLLFSIVASWFLLDAGLEQHITKYGGDFPAVQFLLGPDRQHALTRQALFGRWAVLQIGIVGATAIAASTADRLIRAFTSVAPATSPEVS